MKTIIILLFVALFCSCNKNKTIDVESLFPQTRNLHYKQKKYSDLIMGRISDIHLVNNKLFMMEENGDSCFYIIDMVEDRYVGGFGKKGQGPDEFLQPYHFQYYSDSILAVFDLWKGSLIGLKANSVSLGYLQNYNIMRLDSVMCHSFVATKYNTYIAMGGYKDCLFRMLDPKGHRINDFFEYPYKDEYEKSLSNRLRAMAYQGKVLTNPSMDKLVFAVSYSPIISFYQITPRSLKLLASIISAYPEYKPEETSNSMSAAMSRNNKIGYIDVYTTEQYVYALYSGKTIKDAASGAFESNQVLVFDWSGNPVTKYALDIFVTEICISPDDAVLYAISNKPDPELIYFNLKSN